MPRRPTDLLSAALMNATARTTVRYGEELRFGGEAAAAVTRERVRLRTRHGKVPVHVYRPGTDADGPDARLPVHVHLHGGAWLMRHPGMDDFWCRYVAARTGVAVANVDFSVAPRVAYPVAQEQVHDVVAALARAGRPLGLDGRRLSLGGFSSGGGMAAGVCHLLRDSGAAQVRLQVLGVPALDVASPVPTTSPGMLSPALRELVRRVYFPDVARRAEPAASPLLAADLAGLPPAVVLTAERDALRAEGDAYAERLRAAGVAVRHDVTPRADHYFLSDDLDRAEDTMAWVADAIDEALRD